MYLDTAHLWAHHIKQTTVQPLCKKVTKFFIKIDIVVEPSIIYIVLFEWLQKKD